MSPTQMTRNNNGQNMSPNIFTTQWGCWKNEVWLFCYLLYVTVVILGFRQVWKTPWQPHGVRLSKRRACCSLLPLSQFLSCPSHYAATPGWKMSLIRCQTGWLLQDLRWDCCHSRYGSFSKADRGTKKPKIWWEVQYLPCNKVHKCYCYTKWGHEYGHAGTLNSDYPNTVMCSYPWQRD